MTRIRSSPLRATISRAAAFHLYLLLALLCGQGTAAAHDTGPLLYVDINEMALDTYAVAWRTPYNLANSNIPTVSLPESCRPASDPLGSAGVRNQLYSCAGDISGEAIAIDYPQSNPGISTFMHLSRLSGESHSQVLAPDVAAWRVPEKEELWSVARNYTLLGIEHIFSGHDHLLFIACLLLLAGSLRRVAITITGFTIAHSITLCLAALGLLRVAPLAVEANIALSIVFVASELARDRRDTLTWRYPIAVSSTFGLLHGFGFAGALADIGLPQTELPTALLFFNVGVEIGQLLFVIGAVSLFLAISPLVPKLRDTSLRHILSSIQRPLAYVVGSLAMFWTIERLSGLWA